MLVSGSATKVIAEHGKCEITQQLRYLLFRDCEIRYINQYDYCQQSRYDRVRVKVHSVPLWRTGIVFRVHVDVLLTCAHYVAIVGLASLGVSMVRKTRQSTGLTGDGQAFYASPARVDRQRNVGA